MCFSYAHVLHDGFEHHFTFVYTFLFIPAFVHHSDNHDFVHRTSKKSFRDVQLSWKNDDSVDNACCIWNCMFGVFEQQSGWELRLEDKFVKLNSWRYIEVDDAEQHKQIRRGCVSKIIRQAKVNMVRRVNDSTLRTHGGKMGIKQNDNKTYTKRRQKGLFDYSQFVRKPVRCCLYCV